jgi:hypothetical protein
MYTEYIKKKSPPHVRGFLSVGVARFELTTSTSQMWRDTGLRYTPDILKFFFESANIRLF